MAIQRRSGWGILSDTPLEGRLYSNIPKSTAIEAGGDDGGNLRGKTSL